MSSPYKRTVPCRHFRGDVPCWLHADCRERDCEDFTPIGERVLIVQYGALGDVLRTTTILPALRRRHPDALIAWLTAPAAVPLIETQPELDEAVGATPANREWMLAREFDALYCADKEPEALAMATRISAQKKMGMGLDTYGRCAPLNPEAETFWRLGFNDELKFRQNEQTHAELVHAMFGLEGPVDPANAYVLPFDEGERRAGAAVLEDLGWLEGPPPLGFNTGAGARWPTKAWPAENWLRLIALCKDRRVLLLGGAEERELNARLVALSGDHVRALPRELPLREFAAVVASCSALVSADTLALHIGLATGVPTIGLFGPTTPVEVGGLAATHWRDIECAPCYRPECPTRRECLRELEAETVHASLREVAP